MRLTVRFGERMGELGIPIMHPFLCLQSLLAIVIKLYQDTDLAQRQLEASPSALREYLSEVLEACGRKHITDVL